MSGFLANFRAGFLEAPRSFFAPAIWAAKAILRATTPHKPHQRQKHLVA